MSLPLLVELPPSLVSLAERAETSLQGALAEHDTLAQRVAAWPRERHDAWRQVSALSDFVAEQAQRDPQMFVALAESGELERSLAPGELRQQLDLGTPHEPLARAKATPDVVFEIGRCHSQPSTHTLASTLPPPAQGWHLTLTVPSPT